MSLSNNAWAKVPKFDTNSLSLSISFWYKNQNTNARWPLVFNFFNNIYGFHTDYMAFGADSVTNNSTATFVAGDKRYTPSSKQFASEWSAGTWKHYAWVLHRSDYGRMADWGIYKDGVKVAELKGEYPSLGTLDDNYFGINYLANNERTYFEGKIDSFGIFPYALTQYQITSLYQTTYPGLPFTNMAVRCPQQSSPPGIIDTVSSGADSYEDCTRVVSTLEKCIHQLFHDHHYI
jgi:hypothetical protein